MLGKPAWSTDDRTDSLVRCSIEAPAIPAIPPSHPHLHDPCDPKRSIPSRISCLNKRLPLGPGTHALPSQQGGASASAKDGPGCCGTYPGAAPASLAGALSPASLRPLRDWDPFRLPPWAAVETSLSCFRLRFVCPKRLFARARYRYMTDGGRYSVLGVDASLLQNGDFLSVPAPCSCCSTSPHPGHPPTSSSESGAVDYCSRASHG